MRRSLLSICCGLVLASTLVGCGGSSVPAPPDAAKDGPPPGGEIPISKAKK